MEEHENSVVVTDIKMPFLSMVVFMVKWAIAAIPAIVILAVLGMVIAAAFSSVGVMGSYVPSPSAAPASASVAPPNQIASAHVLYQGYLAAISAGSQATADNYAEQIRENYPDSPERRLLDDAE